MREQAPKIVKNWEILTTEEASDFLRCSRSFLYKLASEGKLKLRKLGRKTLVKKSDLLKLLED